MKVDIPTKGTIKGIAKEEVRAEVKGFFKILDELRASIFELLERVKTLELSFEGENHTLNGEER